MAEMKLQELAKELKKTGSEVIELGTKKGISGLSQQSVLSEEQVKDIRTAAKEGAPTRKKMHLVFHPEHSSKPLPQRRRPAPDRGKEKSQEQPKQEGKKLSEQKAVQQTIAEQQKTLQPGTEQPTAGEQLRASEQPKPAESKAAETIAAENKAAEEKVLQPKPQETQPATQPQPINQTQPKAEEGKSMPQAAGPENITEEKAVILKGKEEQGALDMQTPEKKTAETNSGRNGNGGQQGRRDGQNRRDAGPRKEENSQSRRDGQRRRDDNGQGRRDDNGQPRREGQGNYSRRDDNGQGRRDDNGQPRREGQGSYGRRDDNSQGRRDGQGSYGRRDDNSQGRRDGQGNYGRRDDNSQGRRDGQGSYGRRDDNSQGRREGQGSYGRRDDNSQGRRDGQGSYGRRDDNSQGRRDGQGGYGRRDDNSQGRREGQGSYGRRDGYSGGSNGGQGGYQKKDQDFSARRTDGNKDRGSKFSKGGMDSLTPAMTKNEARGGKGLNKKERELREKSKQNADKTGRFEENSKNFSKLKNPVKKNEPVVQEKKEEDVIRTMILPEAMTIGELAEKMKMSAAALIKAQFMKGNMYSINAEITYEQAEEIALDYNFICEPEEKVDVIEELLKEEEENAEDMVPRPPVICVMGHVDHGKTSLLDAIRSTNVIAKEAGGITQHIGAYTVKCNGQDITFLDTPGHEAFTAMRMRGAQATDIAVLVVAADDGVMPQTIEAINHAKAAGVDIIVAVNKIDKPSANVDRVMKELSEYELVPEAWGGQTIFVPVSAKTHEGIENLLEMILLDAEVKELRANPNRRARGLVIEAQLDKGRGPVATILVQKGTLKVGDTIAVGSCFGKVRAMIDDKGRRVKEAKPSTPVEILGLNDVPNAGEVLVATENEKAARSFAETFIKENREKMLADTKTKLTLDSLNSQIHEGSLKELNIIIKADVQGSVEAVKQSLLKLSNDEVVVRVIHGGVGAINESDVTLASASNAIIIGFDVRPDAMAKSVAEREKVEIRLYRVIYQAISDVQAAMKGMLDPIFEEKIIGHAQVRQIFRASGVGNIAGSYVTDGVFQRNCKIRIRRAGEQIYEGALASLKRFKDDVKEVKEGYECGLVFEKFNDIQEEDEVEAYIMVEVPR